MNTNLLDRAIKLIEAGDTEQGGKILSDLLKENQDNENAWVWLHICVKLNDQKIFCLQKVLELNPNHPKAKAKLAKLIEQQNSIREPEPVTTKTNKISLPLDVIKPFAEKNRRRKTKSEPETTELEAISEESVKPNEPHEFNPNIYNVIFTKSGENLFAKENRKLNNFPEIDSGMYGSKLVIGGVSITSYDYPKCVEVGVIRRSQCLKCDFFSVSDCPIRRDSSILHDAKTIFRQNKRYQKENRERRDAAVDTIFNELKSHGRPLHYEVLAQIIRDRHPRLRLTPTMILRFMSWHPDKFEWVDTGVYRAK